ncbi:hypothetical protein TCA2_4495 [Paenibacillus sp. TCA20]|nr:hypothetical protein TCA2_4495 [Paenibacillus sp. TCA20]
MELMSPYFERTIVAAHQLIPGNTYSFYYEGQYHIAVFHKHRHDSQVLIFHTYTINNQYCRIGMMFAPDEIDQLSIYMESD